MKRIDVSFEEGCFLMVKQAGVEMLSYQWDVDAGVSIEVYAEDVWTAAWAIMDDDDCWNLHKQGNKFISLHNTTELVTVWSRKCRCDA